MEEADDTGSRRAADSRSDYDQAKDVSVGGFNSGLTVEVDSARHRRQLETFETVSASNDAEPESDGQSSRDQSPERNSIGTYIERTRQMLLGSGQARPQETLENLQSGSIADKFQIENVLELDHTRVGRASQVSGGSKVPSRLSRHSSQKKWQHKIAREEQLRSLSVSSDLKRDRSPRAKPVRAKNYTKPLRTPKPRRAFDRNIYSQRSFNTGKLALIGRLQGLKTTLKKSKSQDWFSIRNALTKRKPRSG